MQRESCELLQLAKQFILDFSEEAAYLAYAVYQTSQDALSFGETETSCCEQ